MDEEGYPVELFLTPPHEEFHCAVCFGVAKEATKCPDEHVFCKGCIEQWLNKGQLSCPVDRAILPINSLTPFRAAQNIIGKYCIRCPSSSVKAVVEQPAKRQRRLTKTDLPLENALQTCCWTGPVNELTKHMSSCPVQVSKCPFPDCKKSFPNCALARHQEKCRHRLEPCPHCQKLRKPSKRNIHKRRCPKLLVRCQNVGCKVMFAREDTAQHINHDCAFKVIDCPYKHTLRCNYRCMRKDMPAHGEDQLLHFEGLKQLAAESYRVVNVLQATVNVQRRQLRRLQKKAR